jgi:hypothetical protein
MGIYLPLFTIHQFGLLALINAAIQFWRQQLGRFGLSGAHQTSPISQLSDGLRNRVVFSQLAMEHPHVLLLGEYIISVGTQYPYGWDFSWAPSTAPLTHCDLEALIPHPIIYSTSSSVHYANLSYFNFYIRLSISDPHSGSS